MRLARCLAVAAAVACLSAGAPDTRAHTTTVGDHRTPAGIAFRHLSVPDTHHALAFGWTDGYALTLAGKEGLVVLGPRLLLEGSRTVNESERVERLKDLQASLGLAGSAHATRGFLAAPKAKFAEAVELLADLLADPALPAAKLADARRSLAIASRQGQENAETLAGSLFARLTLPQGPLLRLSVADPAIYEAVEIADIEAWRRTVLGRDRLTVASAGPLTAEEAAVQIDRIFARLPATGHAIGPPPEMRAAGKLIVLERPVVQTAIVAGGPSGWISEPDTLQGTVAVRILGAGGFESRLVRAVREGLGATYGIRAGFQQLHPKAFTLVINTAVDNAKVAATIAAIRKEYARMRADGVTEAEVEPIKTKLLTEFREGLRRALGAAGRVRDLAMAEYPSDHLAIFEARLRGLSAASVSEAIRARFPKEPLTIVVVAPSAQGLEADCVIKAPAELARCE
jgi:zinc protease